MFDQNLEMNNKKYKCFPKNPTAVSATNASQRENHSCFTDPVRLHIKNTFSHSIPVLWAGIAGVCSSNFSDSAPKSAIPKINPHPCQFHATHSSEM